MEIIEIIFNHIKHLSFFTTYIIKQISCKLEALSHDESTPVSAPAPVQTIIDNWHSKFSFAFRLVIIDYILKPPNSLLWSLGSVGCFDIKHLK